MPDDPTSDNHSPALRVQGLSKSYSSGQSELTVLADVSFDLEPGSICSIVGPSGSGKTTLLGLCAGLDRPSAGTVELAGQCLADFTEDELARLRNREVGFVFQSFNLMATLTAMENVMVPLELRGDRTAGKRAAELLSRVGLGDRMNHYPAQLSGGEQQRVALARAFIHKPRVLFADEPTGNLDVENGDLVIQHLFELNHDAGITLVLVTHDLELAARTQRILHLKGGRLTLDERTGQEQPAS